MTVIPLREVALPPSTSASASDPLHPYVRTDIIAYLCLFIFLISSLSWLGFRKWKKVTGTPPSVSHTESPSHSSTVERWKAHKKLMHILPHSRSAATHPIPVTIPLSQTHLWVRSRSVGQHRIDYPYAHPDHGRSTISVQSEATLVDDVAGRSEYSHAPSLAVNVPRPAAARTRR